VRKLLILTLVTSTVVAAACSKKSPVAAMSDGLKQDLKLASTTQDIRINPDEIAPTSKPMAAPKVKKAPSGPKVIRSEKPTVMASAAPVEAAEIKTDVPDVQVMASAPAPAQESTPDAPPLARPSTIPVGNAGGQGRDGSGQGRADGNGGSGSIWGGILGAVIRGGVVGDDDHCDPRSTMPRHRPTDMNGGIYGRPNPMGRGRPIMTGGIGSRGR
jgi:hypothetical protein